MITDRQPGSGTRPSHYVGIGASAGGLEAIEAFFSAMPTYRSLAFIVVQHLSPDYKSLMVELLSKKTAIPVHRAEEGMVVLANAIYLIPPKKLLTIDHGRLRLSDKDIRPGADLPIDIFFSSLAADQGEKAIAVVLSGTGSDGTRGARAIKEMGGMVLVQNEESAKFDGMPRAAISTGLADSILPPEKMAGQILAYVTHPCVSGEQHPTRLKSGSDALGPVLVELQARTGIDFTIYKPSIVGRRVERRMSVNQIGDVEEYVAYLCNHPGEVMALYRDLLIGVTSFFRDPEAMQELAENWLPALLRRRQGREIRCWVAGGQSRRGGDSDTDRLLRRYLELMSRDILPPTVIVNEQMEIVHIVGNVEGYFKIPSGPAEYAITRMAARELAIPLSTGVQKVFRTGDELTFSSLRVQRQGEERAVRVRIAPLPGDKGAMPLVAVLLAESGSSPLTTVGDPVDFDIGIESRQRIADLEEELQFARENLQASIEELETANEELQATNEELLASNEELQSTNEELQSTNEELYTVNSEHQNKIVELTELNNDVDNLLTGSLIGTLLLDEDLLIRKFSPEVVNLFPVMEKDIGRPLAHIAHFLGDLDLLALIVTVQRQNRPLEKEVQSSAKRWYLLRILPYSISPKAFAGVVLTFIDITDSLHLRREIAESEQRYRGLMETMSLGMLYQNAQGEVLYANPAAERISGFRLAELRGKIPDETSWRAIRENGTLLPSADYPAMLSLHSGGPVFGCIIGLPVAPETTRWLLVNATPKFRVGEKVPYEVYSTLEDISLRFTPMGVVGSRP